MIPLIYSQGYNITACGLERLHPFDSAKFRRIHDELIRQGLRRPEDFISPPKLTLQELETIHSRDYLRSSSRPSVLARILEVPIVRALPAVFTNWRVLRPMRLATGGTVLACRLALEKGLAINLGGGFHHASGTRGGGFCVYADVPLALALLHREGRIRSALIIDTDAHQGDGTADAIRPWGWAHLLDLFDQSIYPPKVQERYPVPLPPGTEGETYLRLLEEQLEKVLKEWRPELIIANAGSDAPATDPLSRLRLQPEDLEARDLMVVSAARARGIPLAMVLSGGYGPLSWRAHAWSLEGILTRYDREIAAEEG